MNVLWIAIGMSALNLLLLLYVFHKVRRVHLMCYKLSDDIHRLETTGLIQLHQQLQTLHGLQTELALETPLPPTRGWNASPDFLLILARHAREARPETVVECGSGTSTIVLARCMELNGSGHVYSLEHDADFAERTRHELERRGLDSWATVLTAPLMPVELSDKTWTWYSHEVLPDAPIDMLVIDGPPLPLGPEIRYPAGPILFSRLNANAVVFLDDAAREDEKHAVERWTQEFPDFVREDLDCEKGCILLRWRNSRSDIQ